MGKEKTEFEEKFVSKTEKAKKLWEKRITENTTLSMESVQWMAQRINSLLEYMRYGYALIAYRKQDGSFYMGRGTLVSYESDFKKKHDMTERRQCRAVSGYGRAAGNRDILCI